MNSDNFESFEHKNPIPICDTEEDGYFTDDTSGESMLWLQDIDGKFWIYPKSQCGIELREKWIIASKLEKYYKGLVFIYIVVAMIMFAIVGGVAQGIYEFTSQTPDSQPLLRIFAAGISLSLFGILALVLVLNIIGIFIRWMCGKNRIYIEYPIISAFTYIPSPSIQSSARFAFLLFLGTYEF